MRPAANILTEDGPLEAGNENNKALTRALRHRGVVPCLAVGLALLAIWGLGSLAPTSDTELPADGVGGPAEKPLADVLAPLPLDMGAPDGLGSFVRDERCPLLPIEELGPLFRRDEGPVEMRIGRGQTFYEALAARDVAHSDIMALVKACKEFRDLRKVRSGELFRVHVNTDGGLQSLGFDLDEESHVIWMRDGDTYTREDFTYPVEHRLMAVGGTIEVSLYASLQKLDAPLDLAPKMSDILGWDIDFSRDLRKGDTFRILYEEVWKDGELVRTGQILGVEMENRGQPRSAFLFTSADGRPGYYDSQGNNMAKQLMRAPVQYSRISSGFSYRRFHPVLKRYMPHLGVDYAAPLGTPVRAAGDGTILAATRKEGNGRYIQIRHTNAEYETYYLHLSRFAKGIKRGTRVTQGQIIGYVGASGYASGPHLDFRVKRGGKFVNPRKLKLPAAAPVSGELKEQFGSLTGIYTAVLAEIAVDAAPVILPPLAPLDAPFEGPVFTAAELPVGIGAAN
jgi:murein DD-endopeptidase MepM/ murein hydrolase activator NlpD